MYISQRPDTTLPNGYRVDFICQASYLAGNVSYLLTSDGQAVIYRCEIHHEEDHGGTSSKSIISLLISGQARKVSPTCPTVSWADSADLWATGTTDPTNDDVIAFPDRYGKQIATRIAEILDQPTQYDSVKIGPSVEITINVGDFDYPILVTPGSQLFDIEHHIEAFGEACTA